MRINKIKFAFLIQLVAVFGAAHAQGVHWSWNPHEYSTNSTFVGVVTIEGIEQRSDQLEIGAFCDGICRGSVICLYNSNKDRYFACLTVNGEAGMMMNFRLWDHVTEQELDVASEITYTFQPNDFFGTTSNPYLFPFTLTYEGLVFTGVVDSLWSNSENWRSGILPVSVEDEVLIYNDCDLNMDATIAALTIFEGKSLTVQQGKTLTVTGDIINTMTSGMVIKNGAQLINASENVAATLEQDVVAYGAPNAADGWYTIASPMIAMPIDGSDFLTPEYDLYRYNETIIGEEWENYKDPNNFDFTTFEKGRGYLYANSNTFSPAFVGILNCSTVSCPLTYTERPDGLSGFNLIGNPFPHVIYKGDGGAIDSPSLASGYYTLTNEGAWHVHTYEEAIQPRQGILVKTIGTMDLSINKNHTVAEAETGSAKSSMGRLNLTVSGNGVEDRAYVYFNQGVGLEKMDNFNEEIPSLWIHDNSNDYAIAHIDDSYELLDLFFSNKYDGDFTLSVTAIDTNFNYLQLTDCITGATVNLLQHPEYNFHATGQEYEARFIITFKVATGVEECHHGNFCFVKDGMLYVTTDASYDQLVLTDVQGRSVKTIKQKSMACSVADLAPGLYMVRLTNGGKAMVQKVVVR